MSARRPRVAMLISSGYAPDVRLQKQAHTLAAAGYRVTIVAWDRLRRYPVTARESARRRWPPRSRIGRDATARRRSRSAWSACASRRATGPAARY